jgi:hypothetical protein
MITEIRQMIADALASAPWPVHPFEPDDVNELPCYVVSRPSLTFDVLDATATVPVYAIGRRLNDAESQAELDAATDAAWEALLGPSIGVVAVIPTERIAASVSRPAYRLDAVVGRIECKPREVSR